MLPAIMVLLGSQAVQQAGVKVGDKAPTFKLDYVNGDKQFDLATAIASGKPTVLVFGSYT